MWIYQDKNWPDFKWNMDSIGHQLAELRYQQGHLLGKMESLGFELRQEAGLSMLTSDVVKSSAIEGELLDPAEVRSSIAWRLGVEMAGLKSASRDVEGIVEVMLDATQHYHQPLTQQRLFDWHAALFPTGRSGMHSIVVGHWRTEDSGAMQVVSGPIGREKVHFEAPTAKAVPTAMKKFLNWFNQQDKIDPVLKAGIAHLWFVSIHPFEDGNGRIARAISDMALARADDTTERFYSLSTQIEAQRKKYYQALETQQRASVDISKWLDWFLTCLAGAITSAEQTLANVLCKARLWEHINQTGVNERQKKVINRMLEDNFEGHMNTSKYASIAKCSKDTALRDIQDLKGKGIFQQNPGAGRSTSYCLQKQFE